MIHLLSVTNLYKKATKPENTIAARTEVRLYDGVYIVDVCWLTICAEPKDRVTENLRRRQINDWWKREPN